MENSAITRIISFTFILVILTTSLIFSQITETQITNGEFQQTNPAIWDSIIVYQDGRNTTAIPFHLQDMIRSYNLNTNSDTTVYFLPYHQTYPDVWNNKVVWSERQNIYMYDLVDKSIHNICTADGKQDFPKIEGNYIVWQDERSSTSDPGIFMYDLAADNEIEIADNFTAKDEHPDISGHYVIWVRENMEIHIYDLTTGQTSNIDPAGYIGKAAIYGSMIVWESNVDNYYQIFMYNIDTQQTTQITSGEFHHMSPAISGKGVVWEDYRNSPDGYSNTDIYFYNFADGNEMPISTEEHEQKSPDIFENKIVWQDNRNGYYDIYMAEVQEATGADLEITMTDDPDPVVKGYYETFTIKVFNHGPETAENVKVNIKLPETYFEFVSILSSQGDCSQFSVNDTCYLGNIDEGGYVVITLLTKAIAFLDVNTTAFVNSENFDPNLLNNSVEVNTTISGLFSKYVGRGIYPKIAVDSLNHPKISYTAVSLLGDINYSYINLLDWERELVLWGKPWIHHPLIGYNSDIFVDKNNLPHIVYSFDRNTPDAFGVLSEQYKSLIYTNRENDRWLYYKEIYFCKSVVNGILTNKGTWSPNIVLDKSGYIHVTFLNCSGQASVGDIYYLTNRTGTGEWDSTIVGQGYDYLDMVIDKNDKLHIVYYAPLSIGGIEYQSKEIDGNWGTPELIESNWQGVQMEGMGTGIAIDKKGEPHIIYAGQTDNDNTEDIKYAYKDNGQWHITTLEKGTDMSSHNAIGIDNLDHIHVCYYSMKKNKLIYAVKLDSGWTREVISSKGKWWNDIAVFNDGTAHICYTDDDDRNQIYYASSRVEIDGDLDGISDKSEQGEDGNDPVYDGNGDGIPDFQQKNVTSFHTSDGKYYVTLACDDSLLLSDVSSGDIPSMFDVPPNFDFPFGAFHFTILGLSYGDSTTVDLILPEEMVIDKYYKYGSTLLDNDDHWYEFMYDGETGAVINDNIVTLHLVDGLRGDDDLTVNGTIYEPGLPAVIATEVKKDGSKLPNVYALYQNYPNPFNPSTVIKYSIPSSKTPLLGGSGSGLVTLKIYDILGRVVTTLVNERQKPGNYEVQFDASSLASGIYFYQLRAGTFVKSRKMLLLK